MRLLGWMMLLGTTTMSVAPAAAQRYDPKYPVCLQRWGQGGGTNIDCSFTSLEQCRATASGLSAQCSANPYWPQIDQQAPGSIKRRHGRVG